MRRYWFIFAVCAAERIDTVSAGGVERALRVFGDLRPEERPSIFLDNVRKHFIDELLSEGARTGTTSRGPGLASATKWLAVHSLAAICGASGMPSQATVLRWLSRAPMRGAPAALAHFATSYEQAAGGMLRLRSGPPPLDFRDSDVGACPHLTVHEPRVVPAFSKTLFATACP